MDYRSLRAPALPVTAGPANGSCHVKLAVALHRELVFKIYRGSDAPLHPYWGCISCPTALPGPYFSPGTRQDQTISFQKQCLKKKKRNHKKAQMKNIPSVFHIL